MTLVKPRLLAMLCALAIAACVSGDTAPPPTNLAIAAGDGRVVLTWTASPGVEYWVFGAADPAVTLDNWTSLKESTSTTAAVSPQPICGLDNGTTYWFIANGRTDGGKGGPASAVVSATPRAAGSSWVTATPFSSQIHGTGFTVAQRCRISNAHAESTRAASGFFVAVGASAAIYTSPDAATWTAQSAPAGFSTDLRAVTGDTLRPGVLNDLGLLYVAVGDALSAVYSADGVTWQLGQAPQAGEPNLRAIAHAGRRFVAVGDAGRIRYTDNGFNWFDRVSPTNADLAAISYATNRFIAVGAAGTAMVSGDGVSWSLLATGVSANLRGVAYGNNNSTAPSTVLSRAINTWVIVGDAGTVLYSRDFGASWSPVTLPGSPNLVGVSYGTQFVALDATGNAYTSTDGQTWSTAIATGVGAATGVAGSDYGHLVPGPGGALATSF